jgi:hypothetical protein
MGERWKIVLGAFPVFMSYNSRWCSSGRDDKFYFVSLPGIRIFTSEISWTQRYFLQVTDKATDLFFLHNRAFLFRYLCPRSLEEYTDT